jgi:hypothetical protein
VRKATSSLSPFLSIKESSSALLLADGTCLNYVFLEEKMKF